MFFKLKLKLKRIAPNGASEFATQGPQPSCDGAGDGAFPLTRDF